jgi:hypothetical protein
MAVWLAVTVEPPAVVVAPQVGPSAWGVVIGGVL